MRSGWKSLNWIDVYTMKNFIFGIVTVLISLIAIFVICEILMRGYQFLRSPSPSIVIDSEIGWLPGPDLDILTVVPDASGEYYALRITSDENGFRMFGDLDSGDKKKVLFIGDSYTQAMEVSDRYTYFAQLQNDLDIEIFGLGTGGYGTLQSYLLLQKWLDLIQPDIVIYQFCTNDFINNSYALESKSIFNNNGLKRPYLIDEEIVHKLPKKWPGIRHFANKYSRFLYYIQSRIDIINSQYGTDSVEFTIRDLGRAYPDYNEAIETTQELIRRMRNEVVGADALFLTFSSDDNQPYYSNYLQIVSALEGVHLIEGVSASIKEAEELGVTVRAADKAHWNNEGHRIAAEVIKGYFIENILPD